MTDGIFGLDAGGGPKYSDEEKQIRDLIRRLKKAFNNYWYDRNGRDYRPSARSEQDTTWRKIAVACMRHKAEPEDFMAAQALYSRSLLLPSMLGGKKSMNYWQTYMCTRAPLRAEEVDKGDKIATTTGVAILNQVIDNCKMELQYRVGTDDLFAPGIIDMVCQNQWDYEPMGLMLVSDGHPRIAALVRTRCYDWLEEHPAVVHEMKDKGGYEKILQIINETDPAHPL